MADINIDLGNVRGLQGETGDDGSRGSQWFTGTALTHTTGSASTATGIELALVGDMYLNTETSNVYQCTTGGASGTAVWAYLMNIKGASGDGSLVAETAADGITDVTFTDAGGVETSFRAGNTRATGSSALQINSAFSGAVVRDNACYARGDIVAVNFFIDGFTKSPSTFKTTNTVIATLPEGYRPITTQSALAYLANGIWGYLQIQPDGNVNARAINPEKNINITAVVLNTSFMRA